VGHGGSIAVRIVILDTEYLLVKHYIILYYIILYYFETEGDSWP